MLCGHLLRRALLRCCVARPRLYGFLLHSVYCSVTRKHVCQCRSHVGNCSVARAAFVVACGHILFVVTSGTGILSFAWAFVLLLRCRAWEKQIDADNEEFVVIHRTRFEGESFRLLGVVFDPQLLMHDAVHKLAIDAGWGLLSLLRVRAFHSQASMVKLYKTQILSFLESATPAIAHAAPSVLERIDRVQRRFLREIGVGVLEAFERYKLAPLDTP